MINKEGIVLHKLLKEESLDAFADLKACFFTGAYSPLYRIINKFYLKEGYVPSFEAIKMVTKTAIDLNALQSLEILEVPDVPLELAVQALIDEYAQTEALTAIDRFVDTITYLDVSEIKEGIGEILLDLDRKLNTDEAIMTADQFTTFKRPEAMDAMKVPSGISNWYDSEFGGLYLEELILVGGKRGSGKSLVCANIAAAQYEAGWVVPFYTIEMTGDETFMRIMSILAKVDFNRYRKNLLEPAEYTRLATVRAGMFVDADDLLSVYLEDRDHFKFEKDLLTHKSLKPDNQIVIVDDRELTVTQLDLSMQKLKALHGDRLNVVLVDYVNQVSLGGNSNDIFEWKDQVLVSKQLKGIARKYKVAMVSPYQIDDSGATRFAKGILDACDMALLLDSKKYSDSLLYSCTKARNGSDTFEFRTGMDWSCLRIDPAEVQTHREEEEGEDAPESFSKTKHKAAYDKRADMNGEDDI